MKNRDISYPHPVLGIGSDVEPQPSIVVAPIQSDTDNYIIDVDLLMENEDIANLIISGRAEYVCELECVATFLRRRLVSENPHFTIILNKQEVAKRINVEFTVTAKETISAYTNSRFHEDYKGFCFDIDAGDILAFLGSFHYDVDIIYDKLQTAGSFMSIVPGNDENNTLYYLLNPKIEIQLPPQLFQDYKTSFNGKGKHADIFHSSLVMNALVYAIMSYNESDHGGTLWARTLKYRIELEPQLRVYASTLEEKDPVDVLKLAQALLSNPYKRLMSTMHDLMDQQHEQQGY